MTSLTCPLITLQPIVEGGTPIAQGAIGSVFKGGFRDLGEAAAPQNPSARTIQYNFKQLEEWTQRMCAYVATLEARIAALEGP